MGNLMETQKRWFCVLLCARVFNTPQCHIVTAGNMFETFAISDSLIFTPMTQRGTIGLKVPMTWTGMIYLVD